MIDISIETGRRPLLGLGIDTLHPESIMVLMALRQLAQRSTRPAIPAIVAGGEGELWLFTGLLWQSTTHVAGPAPAIYGGNDLATYAAVLNISALPAPVGDPALPAGMAWMLTPTAVPGSERSDLTYLPFVLRSPLFTPVTLTSQPATWLDQMELWAALLLATALLLAAFLL